jgi:hypothetical protein
MTKLRTTPESVMNGMAPTINTKAAIAEKSLNYAPQINPEGEKEELQ